jgi:multidrug efflux pump subunit AcrA (membrane-fusion protein)
MRRRWKLILFAIVLPLVVIGGCGAFIAQKMRPKDEPPKTAKVARGDVAVTVRETGRVEPIKRVDVKSKVAGKIMELAVDEGDAVTDGQLIARLDVPEVEAQRDQIKAQHDAAKARLVQTRLSCEQSRQMIGR